MEEPSDRRIPDAVVYALIIALVVIVVIGVLILLGQPTGSIFTNIHNGL